tara:strand:- start:252 stop:467 length:216 start_codon:yes stop_codon:yes gene_type:complete
MGSTKNSIIIGSFILFGFLLQSYLDRHETYQRTGDTYYYRYNKWTGNYEYFWAKNDQWILAPGFRKTPAPD